MLLQQSTDNDVLGSISDMHRLQQQLNRLLTGGISTVAHEFPAINIWTSADGAIVRAEIPGFNLEDVDITLVNDTLTMKGERCSESKREFDFN